MNKKQWLLIPAVLILILMITYCYQAVQFQSKFLNKTTIGNTDVSNLDKTQAVKILEKLSEDEVYHVLLEGQMWKDIPKSDFGVEFDVNKTVDDVMAKQNSWLWFMSYFQTPEDVPIETKEINTEKVEAALTTLTEEVNNFNKERTPSKNASVAFKDDAFQIIPETQGDAIDTKKFIEATEKSLIAGGSKIELDDYITKPTILATDTALEEEMKHINEIAGINASYSINGQEIVIPKETIATWIVFEDGKLDLKQDNVRKYVEDLGAKYNTSSNPSDFKSTKRGDVSVPAGAYSWTISVDTETEQLKEAILAGEDFNGKVPAFQGSGSPDSPLIGNTYIEVDLENQHMWYYKDGVSVLDTPVITGKPSTPTPPGVFYVWNKERNATLVGEDYKTPVDYWMPIDWDGVGIHDSPWQSAYGGDSYLTVGSHGCINTPPDICKQLFEMIDVGVPVIVF